VTVPVPEDERAALSVTGAPNIEVLAVDVNVTVVAATRGARLNSPEAARKRRIPLVIGYLLPCEGTESIILRMA